MLFAPSGKGGKRQKKGEKGRFPGRAARHPLSPHLLHPHLRQPKIGHFACSLGKVRKNSLNIKFLGGIFLGHPGHRRRDIPDKNFMQVAFFFWCFRHGVAGMSRDLGRDVPDLEKNYARKLWADFSYPLWGRDQRGACREGGRGGGS